MTDLSDVARKALAECHRIDDPAEAQCLRRRVAELHDELFGTPPVGTLAHAIFYGGDND
jgi:hypothetical protein